MSRLTPRYRRLPDYPEISIGKAKHELLKMIAVFSYLSAEQLTRLLYSETSLGYVRDHLKHLYQAGYVRRVYLPTLNTLGSARAFYTLDGKGYSWLKPFGFAPPGRFRASEQAEREWYFLKHTEAANNLIILAHTLARQDPTVELLSFKTERELKHHPARIQIGKEQVAVVPDGWIDLRKQWPEHRKIGRYAVAFELDRDTTGAKAFTRKIRALVGYLNGPYQQQFGTQSRTIAFVTLGGDRRLAELLSWAETALVEANAQDQAGYFLFAAFDLAGADPQAVFLTPKFTPPFSKRPLLPLLEPPSVKP